MAKITREQAILIIEKLKNGKTLILSETSGYASFRNDFYIENNKFYDKSEWHDKRERSHGGALKELKTEEEFIEKIMEFEFNATVQKLIEE